MGRTDRTGLAAGVAARLGVSDQEAEAMVDAVLEEVLQQARDGNEVRLHGFGRFYPQLHKGHRTNFGGGWMDDYMVLKFSADRAASRTL